MSRTIDEWRGIVRRNVSLESSSDLSDEAKSIGSGELKAAMDVVEKNVEDDLVRRKIAASFKIYRKYEALDHIVGRHLADDPDLACELLEAAVGAEVDRGTYLT